VFSLVITLSYHLCPKHITVQQSSGDVIQYLSEEAERLLRVRSSLPLEGIGETT